MSLYNINGDSPVSGTSAAPGSYARAPDLNLPPMQDLTYQLLDNGIVDITLLKGTRHAADELNIIYEAMYSIPTSAPVLLLIDSRQARNLPVKYSMDLTRALNARHPDRRPTYNAIISNPDPMNATVDVLIRFMNLDQRRYAMRFFKGTQREQAIAWLLAR